MGNSPAASVELGGLVGQGKTRICVAGFKLSHHTGRAERLARLLQAAYPDRFETWFWFDWPGSYKQFLAGLKAERFADFLAEHADSPVRGHTTSPIVWLETSENETRHVRPLGGRDRFCEWIAEQQFDNREINELATTPPGVGDAWVNEAPGSAQL